MSVELLVTATIFPRGPGTAADCSPAFTAFSEQHQLVVGYPVRVAADPPPTHSCSLRSAWMEGRYVHITAELWQQNQDVLADKFELCGACSCLGLGTALHAATARRGGQAKQACIVRPGLSVTLHTAAVQQCNTAAVQR
jgi:hypothetical protein